jgi:uncharacterized membrane protein
MESSMSALLSVPAINPSRPEQVRAVESALTVASGALMILPVIGKRSPLRWTAAITGGALIYRGVNHWRDTSSGVRTRKWTSTIEHLSQNMTIGKSPVELFALWRNADILARVMEPFGEVTNLRSASL